MRDSNSVVLEAQRAVIRLDTFIEDYPSRERIQSHEDQLERVLCRLSGVESNLSARRDHTLQTPEDECDRNFPIITASPLQGIISYLTTQTGDNVDRNPIVTISSNSTADSKHLAENIVDLTSKSKFVSEDKPGEWICLEFNNRWVYPTHYTLRSMGLKSWVIEGSMNGEDWREMDRRTDTQVFKKTLRASGKTCSFVMSKPMKCCFIKLTQTDKNHNGDDSLVLFAVEIFGQTEGQRLHASSELEVSSDSST
jgi:hypothetical protein